MKWGKKEYEQLGFSDDCASVLEVDRVQEVIARRADRFNIKVHWSNTADTAVTRNIPMQPGHYEIILPAIQSPCTKEDLIRTYMFVVHECGHLMRPKVWDIAIAAQPPEPLMALYNIVEDDGQEREAAQRYLGDARILGEGNAIIAMDGKLYWEKAVNEYKGTITEESLKPMIALAVQMMSRREWDGWSRDAVDEWLQVMPSEGKPLFDALIEEGWVGKLRDTKDEHDTWQVACDLYDRLYPPQSEEEQKEREEIREAGATETPRESGSDNEGEGGDQSEGEGESTEGNGADKESESESSDAGSGDGEDQEQRGNAGSGGSEEHDSNGGKDSNGCDKGPDAGDELRGSGDKGEGADDTTKGVENADLEGYVINWSEVVMSKHEREGVCPTGGPAGITFEGAKSKGGVSFMPDSENNVIDLTKHDSLDEFDTYAWKRKRRPAKKFLQQDNSANVLANTVRRYVQSQSRVKFRSERENGMINGQEITRLLLPPVDDGNWNKKIFYDRVKSRAINTAVHILVDWSGSMSGKKQEFAAAAAMRAANVFGRSLRMPVMVTSFTTHNTACDLAIIKHFDRPRSDKHMAESFSEWSKWSGGNNDADSVMWAYRRLMERKELRKLLIVMSDGAPAGSYCGDAHSALLAATRHIQDKSDVELFGLGIKSDAVELYYDNYEVVNALEDINGALLGVLKRSISYEHLR